MSMCTYCVEACKVVVWLCVRPVWRFVRQLYGYMYVLCRGLCMYGRFIYGYVYVLYGGLQGSCMVTFTHGSVQDNITRNESYVYRI